MNDFYRLPDTKLQPTGLPGTVQMQDTIHKRFRVEDWPSH